jgi:formyl-CoA transferase
LNIAVANDTLWRKFCDACGFGAIRDDARFATSPARVENRNVLIPLISDVVVRHSRAHWVEVLSKAGVPCGEIRTVGEVCTNEAMIARGMIRDVPHEAIGHVRMIDTPMLLLDTPGGAGWAAPTLGQHTAPILTELAGLTAQDIERLATCGTIKCGGKSRSDG